MLYVFYVPKMFSPNAHSFFHVGDTNKVNFGDNNDGSVCRFRDEDKM